MDAKKQTAVEWLVKKLQNRQNGIFDGLPHLSLDEIYDQAKALEKEQMGDAYYDGKNNGMDICNPLSRAKGISFEQYYNETYNK